MLKMRVQMFTSEADPFMPTLTWVKTFNIYIFQIIFTNDSPFSEKSSSFNLLLFKK